MKKLTGKIILTCFALSLAAISAVKANAAMIETDIVIFMDESGSMNTDGSGLLTENIFSNLSFFNSSLLKRDIKANYSVVAFGGSSNDFGRILQDFTTDLSALFAAVSDDDNGLEYTGKDELPFIAIQQALSVFINGDVLSYTGNAIKNFIVFTDEEADDGSEAAVTQTALEENNVRLNAVLSGGSTSGDLGSVAIGTGGNVFDLETLKTTSVSQAENFMSGLGDVKASEIIEDYCGLNPNADVCTEDNNPINAPASLGLMFAGMIALAIRQRRRRV
ncbi:VWA domain-containing protein [Alteromonas antoniana]|uniref:VWA domain-containing protein n=1 Tax=Alteromonas antoniana TaxID=2803813 RepID=UPI001C48CEC2|nr:VWA domain-containing protein [Alteromonas antoniana]